VEGGQERSRRWRQSPRQLLGQQPAESALLRSFSHSLATSAASTAACGTAATAATAVAFVVRGALFAVVVVIAVSTPTAATGVAGEGPEPPLDPARPQLQLLRWGAVEFLGIGPHAPNRTTTALVVIIYSSCLIYARATTAGASASGGSSVEGSSVLRPVVVPVPGNGLSDAVFKRSAWRVTELRFGLIWCGKDLSDERDKQDFKKKITRGKYSQ